MRLACIDIGTNTTRLLVAERDDGRLLWVHEERSFTRLGHELSPQVKPARIGRAKIDEVVEIVGRQLASARQQGAGRVLAVATAGIRTAANGPELVTAIYDATGLTVEILSAQEEARLAFVGAAGTLDPPPPGEFGVVDVGGGSSELVVGSAPNCVRWWASLPIGSASLASGESGSDPPTTQELASGRARVANQLKGLGVPRLGAVIAVGGSATSLARLAGLRLDGAALERALALLTTQRSSEIARRFAIDPVRARLLPAGLLILEGASRAFGAALTIGRGGIREGVLLEASAP